MFNANNILNTLVADMELKRLVNKKTIAGKEVMLAYTTLSIYCASIDNCNECILFKHYTECPMYKTWG